MTTAPNSWLRFGAALTLILAAGGFLDAHRHPEAAPVRRPLAEFPKELGGWKGKDFPLQEDVLKVLGAGDVLARLYTNSSTVPPIDLFIAYFPSQRTGETMHSPQNCLPGTGWAPLEHSFRELNRPGGGRIVVNRYLIAKGLDRDMVLYWYQSHGRVVASEYWAKFYLVADSIRSGRSDGSLIRVITPVGRNEDIKEAEARAAAFAEGILPLLDNHIPQG
jgi:EpsI family protein